MATGRGPLSVTALGLSLAAVIGTELVSRWDCVFGVVNVGLMVVLPPSSLFEAVEWARWALGLGTGVGFLVG